MVRSLGIKTIPPKFIEDCLNKNSVLDHKVQAFGSEKEYPSLFRQIEKYPEIKEDVREEEEEPQTFDCYKELSESLQLKERIERKKTIHLLIFEGVSDETVESVQNYIGAFFNGALKTNVVKGHCRIKQSKRAARLYLSKRKAVPVEKDEEGRLEVHDLLEEMIELSSTEREGGKLPEDFLCFLSIIPHLLKEGDVEILGRARGESFCCAVSSHSLSNKKDTQVLLEFLDTLVHEISHLLALDHVNFSHLPPIFC